MINGNDFVDTATWRLNNLALDDTMARRLVETLLALSSNVKFVLGHAACFPRIEDKEAFDAKVASLSLVLLEFQVEVHWLLPAVSTFPDGIHLDECGCYEVASFISGIL